MNRTTTIGLGAGSLREPEDGGTIMLGALANILQLNNITPAMPLLATSEVKAATVLAAGAAGGNPGG